MNPLDKEEFQAFLEQIKSNMPLHTDQKVAIPKTPLGHLPKNLMDHSANIDNKFLNQSQDVIEEIHYRDPSNQFVNDLRKYQVGLYQTYEILNHDNFYVIDPNSRKMIAPVSGASLPVFTTMFTFGTNAVKTNGATLESNSGGSTNGLAADNLQAVKMSSTGIAGEYYDQLAFSISSGATGNLRLGCYDDSSAPVNLLADSGSFGMANDYAWHSVTEFALTTSVVWVAFNTDTSVPLGVNSTTPTNGRKVDLGIVYGAMPNPFGTVDVTDSSVWQMKVGHS